jgi:uncharacterized protein (DUF362 family)
LYGKPRVIERENGMETVAIQRIREGRVEEAVRRAVADVGGMSRYVASGARVLIKPNLLCTRNWRTGTTVNPAVVEAIVHLAWEAGAGDVLIGDGSGVGEDTDKVFQVLGYDVLARRCGARLVNLNRNPERVECPMGVALDQIPISRTALEADVLVNIPMLKTHSQTIVTLSLKNMKGVVHSRGKREMHFVDLEQGIVDLNRVIAAHLVVVDGTVGQEGLGPAAGEPVEMNLILAGTNRVAVDAVCCHVMGVDPQMVRHITLASEAGLGPLALEEIVLKGESLKSVQRPFKLPVFDLREMSPYEGVSIVEGTACSGCTGQVMVALKELQENGELDRIVEALGQLSIIYGEDALVPDAPSKSVCLYLGKCQRDSRNAGVWVPGCPAIGVIIQDVLRQIAGLPAQNIDNWSAAADEFTSKRHGKA